MINCVKCGRFISHDWSNLSHTCDVCGGDTTTTGESFPWDNIFDLTRYKKTQVEIKTTVYELKDN